MEGEDQGRLIRAALRRYLDETNPRETDYRVLSKQHGLLPILPEWSGFVGLRDDGALFWVSEDDRTVSPQLNQHALHLAKIRGAELFPELGFLKPVVSPEWVTCWSCDGTGKVTIQGQAVDGIRCLCGGIGKLPPLLAELLRGESRES